ncbi:hypothetical protein [Labilibaculum manganireducens]|nr:hypothetical protein [Labilibaculum manganireducens]
MKTRKNYKAIEVLNQNELTLVKGGEEGNYIIVIIDGKEVRIYV